MYNDDNAQLSDFGKLFDKYYNYAEVSSAYTTFSKNTDFKKMV